jgi:hypothetical protein
VPALEFVRQYKPLAAAVSKATPGIEPVRRDSAGNRKISSPDFATLTSIHRNIARRNKDAKMTLQMLPDLKLALEMVVSLILSPKDMFSDEVIILSDSLDLLPASMMQSMLQVTTDYYRKNFDLSEFLQHMLLQTLGYQGALPVAVIPENSLDDVINNYNSNVSLESFRTHFDLERNIPHPLQLLGVPDYLSGQRNNNTTRSGALKFGSKVSFNLESYETYRGAGRNQATTSNASIAFSRLMPGKDTKEGESPKDWKFKPGFSGEGQEISADNLVFVTDNITALKMPNYKNASLESRVGQAL